MKNTTEQNSYLEQMAMRDTTAAYRIIGYRGNMKMIDSPGTVNICDTDFFKNALKGHGIITTYDESVNGTTKRYIVLARPICSASTDFPTGAVCEFIDPSLIIESLPVHIRDTQIMITDNSGLVIVSSDSELLPANNMLPLQSLINDSSFTDWINSNNDSGTSVYHYTEKKYSQYVTCHKFTNMGWNVYISVGSDLLSIDTSLYTKRIYIYTAVYLLLIILAATVYLLPVFRDISHKKIRETQSLMFANVSHELRTPLNTIIGISEILSHSNLGEGQLRQISYIADSGKNLLAMINDLLDFSKLSSNKFELIDENYLLEDIIYDTTTSATIRLDDKPIDYLVNISSYVPNQLTGDSRRVRQILT
ncbi:MAG: hypothetical protein K2K09_00725, partial [Lachnospiraceae bacterium]|nr:hypothetical protein [Lachnospiraceae bacterium]